eukprot:scaffold170577_cov18-Tisochrysis_lutea.AAC.1
MGSKGCYQASSWLEYPRQPGHGGTTRRRAPSAGSPMRQSRLHQRYATPTRKPASGPGYTMASRSWDPMQEQAPPNLLPPVAPLEPPLLIDPAREVIDRVVGFGSWVRRRPGS